MTDGGNMICTRCGTENPAGARFCKHCGTRLDVCAACGAPLAPDSRFCNMCGAAVNAPAQPVYAAQSAYVPQPAYAPVRPAPAQPAAQPAYDGAREKRRAVAQRVLGYVGNGLAMLGALIAFIFVFLIGTTINADGSAAGADIAFPVEAGMHSLYDYFGAIYREIGQALAATEVYPGYYPTSLYVTAIFGTVSAAAALLATAVLFILTLVRYLLNLTGKTQKGAGGLAAATFFSFLVGALLFMGVECASVSISYSASGITAEAAARSALNGTTIAGICVSAVCMAGYLGCAIARGGRENGIREAVLRYVFCGAGLAFTVLFLALLSGGCAQFMYSAAGSTSRTGRFILSSGFAGIFQIAGSMSLNFNDIAIPEEYAGDFNFIMGFSIAGFALQFALCVVTVFLLVNFFRSLTDKRKGTLGLSLAAAILAIATAVFAALIAAKTTELINELGDLTGSEQYRPNVTMTVLVAVFAAIVLVLSIVHTALTPRPKRVLYYAVPVAQPVPVAAASQPAPAQTVPAAQPAQDGPEGAAQPSAAKDDERPSPGETAGQPATHD